MHVLPPYRRMLLLTEGRLGVFSAKTAASILRYRGADVMALVDSVAAGADVRELVPWAPAVPIVSDVDAAAALHPEVLVIGIAPPGGALPAEMRKQIGRALELRLDVVSGLHEFLSDDPELAATAARSGCRIIDLRRPTGVRVLAAARAKATRCRRVLTVGTDGNVGKMVTALELTAAARGRGLRAEFLGTGQTGILIAGRGVAVDAVAADFAPGAVEELVLGVSDCDICFVEGQGSLAHPGFSAVTLALLHGACPHALVLVHHAGRTSYKVNPELRIPPFRELCALYEQAASVLHPCRVAAVALNAHGVDDATRNRCTREVSRELRVPVFDPLADGAAELLEAVLAGCGLPTGRNRP